MAALYTTIYNLFTHEEHHPELPESTQGTYMEQQNDSNIVYETLDMDFSGGDVEQHVVKNEEINAYIEYPLSLHTSEEELEGPMKDQPLSANASPTALSPGYIADSNPEEDKEDPKEDPADHPANR
ncbi:hypothetical protein Tco_1314123 [Tanacetum coccineum]